MEAGLGVAAGALQLLDTFKRPSIASQGEPPPRRQLHVLQRTQRSRQPISGRARAPGWGANPRRRPRGNLPGPAAVFPGHCGYCSSTPAAGILWEHNSMQWCCSKVQHTSSKRWAGTSGVSGRKRQEDAPLRGSQKTHRYRQNVHMAQVSGLKLQTIENLICLCITYQRRQRSECSLCV
ncbi:hypothetical protein chiPu_0017485 [Chiloscyllium punctatum]|uniref:Uncharacterized protein n=1 Tax=Chiloscyllium punctatum TaxID=137246 RepID=A0A401RGE5_CHIPU|nr:hypothetical protein [Chiloscyllium punctatum]